jgi:ABC transporter substrate binding protein
VCGMRRRHEPRGLACAEDPPGGGLFSFKFSSRRAEGRNLRIDYRFAPAASSDQAQPVAKELVALRPDVIFAQATPLVTALQRETRKIPIVFAAIADPIGSGFIASLAHPGSNITGVMLFEPSANPMMEGPWCRVRREARARGRHRH